MLQQSCHLLPTPQPWLETRSPPCKLETQSWSHPILGCRWLCSMEAGASRAIKHFQFLGYGFTTSCRPRQRECKFTSILGPHVFHVVALEPFLWPSKRAASLILLRYAMELVNGLVNWLKWIENGNPRFQACLMVKPTCSTFYLA
jgi:hypothetical protein